MQTLATRRSACAVRRPSRRSSSRSSTRIGCARWPPSPSRRRARRGAAPRPQKGAVSPDETLSSQTVINLDQADAVAEADFHIAYGLYDQAAELVQKALEAAPDRRDLKLKLLEVYFMWGNKDAFLKAAQSLRADIGRSRRSRLEQGRHHGQADLPRRALVHGSDDRRRAASTSIWKPATRRSILPSTMRRRPTSAAASAGLDFDLEASDQRPAPKPAAKPQRRGAISDDDSLDIGARTAAGLEAALFERDEQDDDGGRTTPDLVRTASP